MRNDSHYEPLTDEAQAVAPTTAPQTLREVEVRHIAVVLRLTHGRIGQAAKILGLHRNTLTRKIRQYGL